MKRNVDKSLRTQTVTLRFQENISTAWRIFGSPAVHSATPVVVLHILHVKYFAAVAWGYLTLDKPDGIDWWIILSPSL